MRTTIHLRRIRQNAESIRRTTGVPLIGVVKANAYGHGAVTIADAINDLVSAWYVFSSSEAIRARLWEVTGKQTLCTIVPNEDPIESLRNHRIRPAVWTMEQLNRWRELNPLLSVDTGMQRFAAPVDQARTLLQTHRFTEAFTHASRPEQAQQLKAEFGDAGLKLHAAGTGLLSNPTCWLDAVRPGLALYEGAARVTTRLIDARTSKGPIGYTGFRTERHGVILKGYSDGMRPGICRVNGRLQQIIEVGMQSAYVTLNEKDQAGDEVVFLGADLTLREAADAAKSTPHETLVRLASMGERNYVT